MAQDQGGQEKTEEATPRRLREARKKGQVAKSRDLDTVVILIAGFVLIAFLVGYMGSHFKQSLTAAFDIVNKKVITDEDMFIYIKESFETYLRIILPFIGAIAVVAFAVNFLQIGPIFSGEPMKPKPDRLNMITNIKNMFTVKTFIELLKNIAKITLIFIIAYMVLRDNISEIVLTVIGNLPQSTKVASNVITIFLIKVFICFIIIAIIDLMVQRWQYKKQMRMTKEEVKREYKQDEGDPLIKSIRRQMHQEMAMSDVKQAVGASDVVVTNPTELAIALKYNDKEMVAPQIMAKGQRLFAQMIREVAEESNVPVMRNVPLAWALIELEVGDEIPEDLYAAVAEILIIVYRMKDGGSASTSS